ncbi:hypothetical protein [Sphingobacterium siyangense]|uniref:hypothetical protein n=1 Tax=Sphingobacterium siyangense TaxID=459529 RepID=UPI003C74978D
MIERVGLLSSEHRIKVSIVLLKSYRWATNDRNYSVAQWYISSTYLVGYWYLSGIPAVHGQYLILSYDKT